MYHSLYCVFDIVAASISNRVIQFPNDSVAVRDFTDGIRMDGSVLARHADDFELRRVGAIDLTTGVITPIDPVVVVTARAIVDALSAADKVIDNG